MYIEQLGLSSVCVSVFIVCQNDFLIPLPLCLSCLICLICLSVLCVSLSHASLYLICLLSVSAFSISISPVSPLSLPLYSFQMNDEWVWYVHELRSATLESLASCVYALKGPQQQQLLRQHVNGMLEVVKAVADAPNWVHGFPQMLQQAIELTGYTYTTMLLLLLLLLLLLVYALGFVRVH